MHLNEKTDPQPHGAFFNLLGIVFALSITVAAGMSYWLPPTATERAGLSQLAQPAR